MGNIYNEPDRSATMLGYVLIGVIVVALFGLFAFFSWS